MTNRKEINITEEYNMVNGGYVQAFNKDTLDTITFQNANINEDIDQMKALIKRDGRVWIAVGTTNEDRDKADIINKHIPLPF